jgi:hypothetical protein
MVLQHDCLEDMAGKASVLLAFILCLHEQDLLIYSGVSQAAFVLLAGLLILCAPLLLNDIDK